MRDRFRAGGTEGADRSARLLAKSAFGLDAAALALRENEVADTAALKSLHAMAARRLAGEPVARILGAAEFYGLSFTLNPATLVPRPETELLVDLIIEHLPRNGRLLDLGTGTGCIPIAVLANRPDATALATDIDPEALAAARANALRNTVAERLTLAQGAWFDPVQADDAFDLIVSNPPYIETGEIDGLMLEVRAHDPILALDGGPDGLDPYRIIAAGAARWLRPAGAVMLEIGSTQAAAVMRLMAEGGFAQITVHRDLSGLDRVVIGQLS